MFDFIFTHLCSLTSHSLTPYTHVVDERLASDNTGTNGKLGPTFMVLSVIKKVGAEAYRLYLPPDRMGNWYIWSFMY